MITVKETLSAVFRVLANGIAALNLAPDSDYSHDALTRRGYRVGRGPADDWRNIGNDMRRAIAKPISFEARHEERRVEKPTQATSNGAIKGKGAGYIKKTEDRRPS